MQPLSSYSPMVIFGLCLVCLIAGTIQNVMCPAHDVFSKSEPKPTTRLERTCQGVLGLVACVACLLSTAMLLAKIFAQ
jgi:hypothetical protein